jgi:hypothetical protein
LVSVFNGVTASSGAIEGLLGRADSLAEEEEEFVFTLEVSVSEVIEDFLGRAGSLAEEKEGV